MDFQSGLEMAGYVRRKGVSKGTHDPLEAFCIYMKGGSTETAILVYDLLGIPEGFPSEHENVKIVPVATHTHSAPKPSLVFEEILRYGEKLVEEAVKGAKNVEKMMVRRTRVRRICDFRDRDEETSLPVVSMEFQLEDEKFGIIIFHCHPTVLGPENLMYSSDLAGGIRRKLEEKLSHPVVYLNSCCGNVSTNRTRRERSFDEVDRLAELFVRNLRWEEEMESTPMEFEFREYTLSLPLVRKDFDGLKVDDRAKPGLELLRRRKIREGFEESKVSVVRIGSVKLVFLPFEMFLESCLKLDKNVILINYAHHYRSYVVPMGTEGTYEWIVSPYSEEAEGMILNFLKRVVDGEDDGGMRESFGRDRMA